MADFPLGVADFRSLLVSCHHWRTLEAAAAQQIDRADDDRYLAAQLQTVRDDYVRLDQASRMVETRLDGAIGRIKTILEG